MKLEQLMKYKGFDFVNRLLNFEQRRFDKQFKRGSVYEEINEDFGIFPAVKLYPHYFVGDITKNANKKLVFIGINPAYSERDRNKEQKYLSDKGLFKASCESFRFFKDNKIGVSYYSNIIGFLKRLLDIEIHNNEQWEWLHANLVNLDLIPYHSANASGLRINHPKRYHSTYLKAFIKILNYVNPEFPIIFIGFPTFEQYFSEPIFKDLISYKKVSDKIWVGKIGKYKFIGMPFLNRVEGGKDKLVKEVRKVINNHLLNKIRKNVLTCPKTTTKS